MSKEGLYGIAMAVLFQRACSCEMIFAGAMLQLLGAHFFYTNAASIVRCWTQFYSCLLRLRVHGTTIKNLARVFMCVCVCGGTIESSKVVVEIAVRGSGVDGKGKGIMFS